MSKPLTFNQKLAISLSVMIVAMIMAVTLIIVLSRDGATNTWSDALREFDESLSDNSDEGDLKEAEEMIKENPQNAEGYGKRAEYYFDKDQNDNALNDFNKAISLDPNNYEWYHRRGHVWDYKDVFDKAVQDYAKAIELHPQKEFYFDRAEAYAELGQTAKAMADFDKALEMDYPAATIHHRKGRLYLKNQDLDKAFVSFKASIYSPSDAEVHGDNEETLESQAKALEEISRIYIVRNDFGNAIKSASDWIKKDNENEDAYHTRAQYYKALGDKEKQFKDVNSAIACLTKKIHDEPGGLVYWSRAEYLREVGKSAESKKDFEKALEYYLKEDKNPDNSYSIDEIIRSIGDAKAFESRFQKSIEKYDKQIALKPKDSKAYSTRGWLYWRMRRFDSALRDYQQAQKIAPSESNEGCIAQLLIKNNRFDDAIKCYKTMAGGKTPLQPVDSAFMAEAFYKSGKFVEAIESANKLIKLDPMYAASYYWKGKALEASGKKADGKSCIQQAIALGFSEDEK